MDNKHRIMNCYIDLVISNQTTKIKIQDISDKSYISRTTFYKYFRDIYQVIEEIIKEDAIEHTYNLLEQDIDYNTITLDFYLSFYQHKDFYKVAIKDSGQNSMFETIIELLYKHNCVFIKKSFDVSDNDVEYYAYKYAVTQAMLLKKWMKDDMKVSPEKMTQYYMTDILNG